jgi:hypothetical protein
MAPLRLRAAAAGGPPFAAAGTTLSINAAIDVSLESESLQGPQSLSPDLLIPALSGMGRDCCQVYLQTMIPDWPQPFVPEWHPAKPQAVSGFLMLVARG